ncbi:MAG TPA: hypothetical protein VFT74_18025 [Isosphaeraceae bacterium]|nr:hypothetical protein [Isosphaeraceae bacterium]
MTEAPGPLKLKSGPGASFHPIHHPLEDRGASCGPNGSLDRQKGPAAPAVDQFEGTLEGKLSEVVGLDHPSDNHVAADLLDREALDTT